MNERTMSLYGLVFLFLFMSTYVLAYDTEIDGLRYDWVSYYNASKNSGDVNLVGFSSSNLDQDLSIPCSVKWNEGKKGKEGRNCQVCRIGVEAFKNCSVLKSVNFRCVTGILTSAFENCTSLQTLYFSNSINSILPNAFKGCSSLMEIYIDDNTPPNVYEDSFDEDTYKNAVLYVPEGSIAVYRAHDIWSKFQKITDGTTLQEYTLEIVSSGNGSASYNGTTIRGKASSFTLNEGASATITFLPDNGYRIKSVKVNGTTVSVSDNQYEVKNISRDTIVEVEFGAIETSFSTIQIDGIYYKSIWGYSGGIESVGVTYNNRNDYSGDIVIPSSIVFEGHNYNVTSIESSAFSNCVDLESVSLPSSISRIGPSAFYGCRKLKHINISNTITSFGAEAFYECVSLESIYIPSTIRKIERSCFRGCKNLEKISIPSSITSIDYGAFYGCSGIKELTLPSSITRVAEYSFAHCTKLESVWIESFQTSFGSGAFVGCSELNKITLLSEPTSVLFDDRQDVFDLDTYNNAILYVPLGTVDSYRDLRRNNHEVAIWGLFKNIRESQDNLPVCTMSILASGNGSATYNGTTIRNKTSSFTVNEGTSATIVFTPDDGYRIKTVKVNNSTVSVFNNQYTISRINVNTTVSVEFEAIPPTTYTLSVTASGNGSATYSSTTIRNNTRSFTVNEGTSATITFSPDDGYRIKTVKVNNSTVSVSNNQYTINSISANTTVSVEFEAIPPTTYTLSVTASGNGSATYGSTAIRNNTRSFTVNEGTSATITFTPDDGYRIKAVKVNNSTVSVSKNQYTINSISANTTVSVEFEAIPITTYTLSVTASGNGSAIYSSTTIRNNTRSFTVNEGTSATITFSPDDGYRIKAVKVNNSTVSVSNNQYTISSISANTTISVEFEAIPPTTYTLSVTASGNGSATYSSTTIRNNTRSFTVNEGTSATITFSPDDGYRIKTVKVNNSSVSVSNNQYTISSINANTTVSVEFEAIPITTYTLSVTASGNGSAIYSSTTIRNNTRSFTVNEGTFVTITFTPDDGYRIKTVKVNNSMVSVPNNWYNISSINGNTTISVEFEAIPPTTYTLSVTASGNGSATYSGTSIRNRTSSFTVNEGTSATITFSPDDGYRIKTVKVNNSSVSVSNNQYTISSINANTTVSVEFEAIPPTTYTLSITASGSGSATYSGTTIRSKRSSFTVNEGTPVTITFTPDDGYRIKTVWVNNATASVSNNPIRIRITANTTVSVEFEAIPPTTYTLSVTASGSGSATYSSTAIRNNTRSFTVNEGTSATITFSPDDGYRIKTVKLNNSIVSVPNNWYNISSINANTTVSVEFEAIPPTPYTLSVTASGNGSATYGSTAIRNNTRSFTVNEGTSATITFSPDDGYRIKTVKVNNSTVSVSNNRCTISIGANTTVSVEFEAIPPTTYTLSVTASGNGSATYGSTAIRNNTRNFTVNEGASATITFIPDDGYRIKSVKVNNYTVSVSNNQYTINSINANTTVSVEFEAIPAVTYSLSITASGNGFVTYNTSTICNDSRGYILNEGTSVSVSFTPDEGYQVKSVRVNGSTVSAPTNSYYISSITKNTTIEVEFEAIPIKTFTLMITANGNGSATYGGTTIRRGSQDFTLNEGTSATITFTPDDGYRIKTVKVNNSTVSVSNNQYTINSITTTTAVEVEFEAIPPTTYTLSITASGNGSATYGSTAIRNNTRSFTVNEGESATITFSPNSGYRIKTVKVNGSTVSVSNNSYTISNITRNTTVEVEFEAIPPVTYSLSITASGNGSVSYNTSTIRNDSRGYVLNEGTSVSISITPDEGYQVKSFKVNGSTVSVPTNSYYISGITRNSTIEVEFEEIPKNSEGWYNTYITCINRTESKIVAGSNVQKTVGFEIANSGNRSVYVTKLVARHPDTNATLTTSTDMSLLGELKPDSTKALSISLRVDVSPIYEITYTVDSEEYLYDNTQYLILSIKGNKFGVVKFMEASVGVDLKKFSIKPGDNATIEFVPNNGCVLTKATVKDTDITSNIVGSKYTIANITSSTSVNAVFDGVSGDSRSINGHEYVDLGLPSGKYWSTVNYGAKNPEDAGSYSSVHNLGTVSSEWGEYWISPTKDDMQELLDMCEWNWSELNGKKGFIIKGPNGNTMFLPAAGMHYSTYYSSVGTLAYYCTSTHDDYSRYCVFKGDTSEKEFMLESGLLNQYSVRPISTLRNESVFSVDGLHFSVISDSEKTVSLAKGNYGKVLEVPATVKYPSTEWKIVGIDKDALSECNELAAIIWNPDAVFTESVDNPNLLLYVKSADYAPTTIKNVVVNGVADRITLIDASGKNDYYCPQEFTAKEISYTHNYKMETGLGSARGWETIALPFDVQKVTHESKGEIIPFANWKSGDTKKPFWLMTYGANGWTEATNIKANTPYIISMPNHSNYKSEFRLDGRVTFSAENVTMPTSDNLNTTAYNGKTFIPNYTNQSNKNFYALNVNNDLETYSGSDVEGSIFLIGDMVDRVIHPFEAYMTSVSQTRGYIAIDEDLATSIGDISEISAEESPLNIYNLNGQLIRTVDGQSLDKIQKGLPAGVYIVNGKKIIIR